MGPEERRVRPLSVCIFAAYGFSWLWVLNTLTVLRLMVLPKAVGGRLPFLSVTFDLIKKVPSLEVAVAKHASLQVLTALVVAPVMEEILFRVLPLTVVLAFAVRMRREALAVVAVGVSCVLFGWMHGSWFNILIQGVVGLALAWLFLQNARERLFTAYLSCVIVHAAYNYTVLLS